MMFRRSVCCSVVVMLGIAISGCRGDKEQYLWEGLLYPKTGTMPYDIAIGKFRSLDECRYASLALLSKMQPEPGATQEYECGYNCKISTNPAPPGQLALRICEDTSR
jgi:hypothetical protein